MKKVFKVCLIVIFQIFIFMRDFLFSVSARLPIIRRLYVKLGYFCEHCEKSIVLPACGHLHMGYSCTREAGHPGAHLACGNTKKDHPIICWEEVNGD